MPTQEKTKKNSERWFGDDEKVTQLSKSQNISTNTLPNPSDAVVSNSLQDAEENTGCCSGLVAFFSAIFSRPNSNNNQQLPSPQATAPNPAADSRNSVPWPSDVSIPPSDSTLEKIITGNTI